MQTRFFTNENSNSLLAKIEGIFKHRQIHFFDALVGYFYASGGYPTRHLMKVLTSYPLSQSNEDVSVTPVVLVFIVSTQSAIIISKSFSA